MYRVWVQEIEVVGGYLMESESELWDELSVACAEIREAIDNRYSEGAVAVLKARVFRMVRKMLKVI